MIYAINNGWVSIQHTDSDWEEKALREAFLEGKIKGRTLGQKTGAMSDSMLGRVSTSTEVTFYPVQDWTREETECANRIDLGEWSHVDELVWQEIGGVSEEDILLKLTKMGVSI